MRRAIILAAAVLLSAGCSYGFEGGGFPPHIRTLYVASFENETPQFDLTQLLFEEMRDEIPQRLGVRVAAEQAADAIINGEIRGYDDVAQNYRPGADDQPVSNVISHEVQVRVSARIVDVRENVIRWEGTLTGRGVYRPDTESDEVGKRLAIENILEQIVDGAQSQW